MTRLACTVAVLVGLTATAFAQDFEAAGRHFSAAQEAFGAKHFKTAAAEFEAAYAITKDPVLLYNVAESYEKAGEGRKAVTNYKSYLKEQPAAQDKAEVQRRIKAIESKGYKIANQSAPGDNPPSTATTTAPTPPPPPAPATPPPTTATPSPPPAATLPPRETPPPPAPAPPPATPQSTAPTTTQTTPPTTPVAPPPETNGTLPMPAQPATPPPPPAATTQAPPPPPGLLEEGPTTKLRVAAWIGVATTLAVLTAGAIFGLSAESRADEINRRLSFVDANNQPHKFDPSAQSDLQSLQSDGNLYNGLAIGFYTAAAASAVVTVTLFIVDAKHGKSEKQQAWHLAPVVGKDAGGLALGGSF